MPLEDGKSTDCQIYDKDEKLTLDVEIVREKETYKITIRKSTHPFSILFHTLYNLIKDCECTVNSVLEGILVEVKQQTQEIILVAKE